MRRTRDVTFRAFSRRRRRATARSSLVGRTFGGPERAGGGHGGVRRGVHVSRRAGSGVMCGEVRCGRRARWITFVFLRAGRTRARDESAKRALMGRKRRVTLTFLES